MKTNISIITSVSIAVIVIGGSYLVNRGGSTPVDNTAGIDSMHGGAAVYSELPSNLVGQPAPAFSLQDVNGKEFSTQNLKGKNIVLFFNEGLMCYPACWNQIVALATDSRFNSADTVAFSVVIDPVSDWQSAIRKMPDLGKATVLFDNDKSVSQAFGMLTVKSSMHYGSYPGHSFVLIDKKGIVRFIFDDPNMGIDNERVAAELQKFN